MSVPGPGLESGVASPVNFTHTEQSGASAPKGASGYIAGVCLQMHIVQLANRLVTSDETQWKRSSGTLIFLPLVIDI